MHDFHHSHNISNYGGMFWFWDTVFGTNRAYYKFVSQLEEKEKLKSEETRNPNKVINEK
jgi:sterol desaturase/sphingolipid hydroxylase (fatty acid hydroxylase superfamily)